MALTAAEIIDEARGYHGAFHRDQIPDKVALKHLTRTERTLAQRITALNEESLARARSLSASQIEAALSHRTGLPLPDTYLVLGGTAEDEAERRIALTLTSGALADQARPPAVYLQRGRVFPVDLRDRGYPVSGWDSITEIVLRYVAVPPPLEFMRQELTLPDSAHPALVDDLALFFAGRENVLRDLPGLAERSAQSTASLLDTMAEQRAVTTWRVRKVQ